MIVSLMGFMGSGKTSIGQRLARLLKYRWIDLDEYIEEQEQQTINQIFENHGERHFRKLEHKYLRQLVKNEKNLVLSLGGGTPCQDKNWKPLRKTKTVYLKRTKKYLFENLKNKKDKRPLIKDLSDRRLKKLIRDRLEVREPYYQKANLVVRIRGDKEQAARLVSSKVLVK